MKRTLYIALIGATTTLSTLYATSLADLTKSATEFANNANAEVNNFVNPDQMEQVGETLETFAPASDYCPSSYQDTISSWFPSLSGIGTWLCGMWHKYGWGSSTEQAVDDAEITEDETQ